MVKIGDVDIRGSLVLAPMAGVTDAPFRALCRAQGAALTCTEMVSAKALVYHDEKTKQLLWSPPDEHPAAAQIFGHEPEVMAEAAPMALEYSGADILDINMGCPVGQGHPQRRRLGAHARPRARRARHRGGRQGC